MLWDVPWHLSAWPVAHTDQSHPEAPVADTFQSHPEAGLVHTSIGADPRVPIRVRLGERPGLPAHATRVGPFLAFDAESVWLDLPEVGTYQVSGTQVTFHPRGAGHDDLPRGAGPDDLRDRALAGPVANLALRNVGLVPVHGTALTHPRWGTAVLVGSACVGVSTLAAAMIHRGFTLIGDELLALQPRLGHKPTVVGGQGCLQLPLDAVTVAATMLERVSPVPDRLAPDTIRRWDLPVASTDGTSEVDAIFALNNDATDGPELRRAAGLARMEIIQNADWHRSVRTAQGWGSDDFVAAGVITRLVSVQHLERVDTATIHIGRLSSIVVDHMARMRTHPLQTSRP
jgi:hypothetical protein